MLDTNSEPALTYPSVQKFLHLHILSRAAEAHGTDFEWFAFPLNWFANEWITKDMARALCRDLRDRGFLRFERGLFNEDGMTAGSGYRITEAGRSYLDELDADHD